MKVSPSFLLLTILTFSCNFTSLFGAARPQTLALYTHDGRETLSVDLTKREFTTHRTFKDIIQDSQEQFSTIKVICEKNGSFAFHLVPPGWLNIRENRENFEARNGTIQDNETKQFFLFTQPPLNAPQAHAMAVMPPGYTGALSQPFFLNRMPTMQPSDALTQPLNAPQAHAMPVIVTPPGNPTSVLDKVLAEAQLALARLEQEEKESELADVQQKLAAAQARKAARESRESNSQVTADPTPLVFTDPSTGSIERSQTEINNYESSSSASSDDRHAQKNTVPVEEEVIPLSPPISIRTAKEPDPLAIATSGTAENTSTPSGKKRNKRKKEKKAEPGAGALPPSPGISTEAERKSSDGIASGSSNSAPTQVVAAPMPSHAVTKEEKPESNFAPATVVISPPAPTAPKFKRKQLQQACQKEALANANKAYVEGQYHETLRALGTTKNKDKASLLLKAQCYRALKEGQRLTVEESEALHKACQRNLTEEEVIVLGTCSQLKPHQRFEYVKSSNQPVCLVERGLLLLRQQTLGQENACSCTNYKPGKPCQHEKAQAYLTSAKEHPIAAELLLRLMNPNEEDTMYHCRLRAIDTMLAHTCMQVLEKNGNARQKILLTYIRPIIATAETKQKAENEKKVGGSTKHKLDTHQLASKTPAALKKKADKEREQQKQRERREAALSKAAAATRLEKKRKNAAAKKEREKSDAIALANAPKRKTALKRLEEKDYSNQKEHWELIRQAEEQNGADNNQVLLFKADAILHSTEEQSDIPLCHDTTPGTLCKHLQALNIYSQVKQTADERSMEHKNAHIHYAYTMKEILQMTSASAHKPYCKYLNASAGSSCADTACKLEQDPQKKTQLLQLRDELKNISDQLKQNQVKSGEDALVRALMAAQKKEQSPENILPTLIPLSLEKIEAFLRNQDSSSKDRITTSELLHKTKNGNLFTRIEEFKALKDSNTQTALQFGCRLCQAQLYYMQYFKDDNLGFTQQEVEEHYKRLAEQLHGLGDSSGTEMLGIIKIQECEQSHTDGCECAHKEVFNKLWKNHSEPTYRMLSMECNYRRSTKDFSQENDTLLASTMQKLSEHPEAKKREHTILTFNATIKTNPQNEKQPKGQAGFKPITPAENALSRPAREEFPDECKEAIKNLEELCLNKQADTSAKDPLAELINVENLKTLARTYIEKNKTQRSFFLTCLILKFSKLKKNHLDDARQPAALEQVRNLLHSLLITELKLQKQTLIIATFINVLNSPIDSPDIEQLAKILTDCAPFLSESKELDGLIQAILFYSFSCSTKEATSALIELTKSFPENLTLIRDPNSTYIHFNLLKIAEPYEYSILYHKYKNNHISLRNAIAQITGPKAVFGKDLNKEMIIPLLELAWEKGMRIISQDKRLAFIPCIKGDGRIPEHTITLLQSWQHVIAQNNENETTAMELTQVDQLLNTILTNIP